MTNILTEFHSQKGKQEDIGQEISINEQQTGLLNKLYSAYKNNDPDNFDMFLHLYGIALYGRYSVMGSEKPTFSDLDNRDKQSLLDAADKLKMIGAFNNQKESAQSDFIEYGMTVISDRIRYLSQESQKPSAPDNQP